MPTTEFNPYDEGPSQQQMEAEANALAQGEKIAQALEEDRARRFDQAEQEAEQVELIAGKFKSQEDLLKAYKELEKRLGTTTPEEDQDAPQEPTEASQEVPAQAPPAEPSLFDRAAQEYEQGGLSEESIEQLAQMDPKELIKGYVEFYQRSAQQYQAKALADAEVARIQQSVGGPAAYAEMVGWAAESLPQAEIDAFNQVTGGSDPVAARFAVEALHARFKASVGQEAPLVTGKKAGRSGPRPYRSQAELARDIANPIYDKDPAFREDVMARLAVSGNLL